MKPGRNDPCPCGSGKKYKHCCSSLSQAGTDRQQTGREQPLAKEPTANEQNHLIALYQARRYAELEIQANLLLGRYPNSGFGWKILSAALAMQGKDDLQALQRAALLLPRDSQVHNNLGDRLAKQEMLQEAESWFRSALRIAPEYGDAHYNLGQVLNRQERYSEAASCLKKAIEIDPKNIEAYVNLSSVLKTQDLHNEAVKQLERALQINPNSAEANSSLGGTLDEQGKFAEAEVYYRRALAIKPDYVMPRFSLVSIKKVREGDSDFEALVAMSNQMKAGKIQLTSNDAICLHFGLGKSYDDLGDHDQAFAHFAEGCRLKRSTFEYNAQDDTKIFDQIMRTFDRTLGERLTGGGNESDVPIFVIGMPRSGTTLTEQIVASHPDVYGAGELSTLLEIARRDIADLPSPESWKLLDRERLSSWSGEYVQTLRRHAPEARRITDKMPQNFLALGLIRLMMPNAKIIHVKRNPVDTCLSCFTKAFSNQNVKFSYDLAELGRYYVNYTRLMEYWRQTLPPGAFIEVQYEDIVTNQETAAQRLIEYCGLKWDPICLDFHKTERSVRTASVAQVRKPVYKSSIERWRRYEQHLGPLLEVLGNSETNR
ncbi:MAG TPA: hypothetical protein DFK12_02180 [Gallionellaceae bacterium]|nr:hypothetical protein [Gallionellaceae bacterium]